MTQYIDVNEVEKKIDLPNGLSLVLLNRLAKESIYGQLECARNIYLVDTATKIIWQVNNRGRNTIKLYNPLIQLVEEKDATPSKNCHAEHATTPDTTQQVELALGCKVTAGKAGRPRKYED